MHELSITQGILDIVLERAEAAKAERISKINLVIGDLSSIVDDCVQFYFDFLSEDTIAKGAVLSFKRIKPQLRCCRCGAVFPLDNSVWNCPGCHEWSVDVVAGREFYIESMEVE